jgi:signal transduction histidine kinase
MKKPLKKISSDLNNDERQELESTLEELHLHQAELEMQNEELRVANERLELQQLKFAGVYDLAPIGYYILNKTGLITEVNNAGAALLETDKAKILNNRLQSFMSVEQAIAFHHFFQSIIKSGKKQTGEFMLTSKKDTVFYVQMEGILIKPIRNLPLQIDIIVMDITSRVVAEQLLSGTKERLEVALEASKSGTWLFDLDTMTFTLDDASYQNIDFLDRRFDGSFQKFLALIHPADRRAVEKQFRVAINHKNPLDVTCRLEDNQGKESFAYLSGHLIRDSGGSNQFVGIIMDVTNREQLKRDAAHALEEQQRNIVLATIHAEENERARISTALHDSVSQLLYGIRMKLSLLTDVKDPKVGIRDIHKLIDIAVLETRNVSFELAPPILKDFGLRSTIEEMAKRISTPKLAIRTKLDKLNERMALATESIIFRILQELVNNAIKHSEGTVVTVSVKQGKTVEIIVADNGKGFAVDSLRDSTSGTGLASIRNRVSLLEGSMHIESHVSSGTTVKVKLESIIT